MRERLSTNFNRTEFACRCGCGNDTVDAMLLSVLQWLRFELKSPVVISSGFRCEEYNALVQGRPGSWHTVGRASDIVVVGHESDEVYNLLDKHFPNTLGLIQYPNFIHVDSRTGTYRKIDENSTA